MPHRASVPRPQGVIVPVVTPLTKSGQLDATAYRRIIDHVIGGGVHAIFALGTTGEGPSLSRSDQADVLQRTGEFVAGRCPIYVGVTDTCVASSLALADLAAQQGASAIVAAPPPYFPAGTREQCTYFTTLAERSHLPLILYNIPQMTKTALTLEAFAELLGHPRIIGVKDSSGLMVYFRRLQHLAARRPDFSVLVGADELLAEAVLLGAHGGVTGGANLAPAMFTALYRAAAGGDLVEMKRLQGRVMQLSCQLYATEGGSYIIHGIKAALAAKGFCELHVAVPLLLANSRVQDAARAVWDVFELDDVLLPTGA
jgi:4-hydroxy-tetrahydrodipicolinate synthase